MAAKSKRGNKTKVKVTKLSQSKKELAKGAMKNVKGGGLINQKGALVSLGGLN